MPFNTRNYVGLIQLAFHWLWNWKLCKMQLIRNWRDALNTWALPIYHLFSDITYKEWKRSFTPLKIPQINSIASQQRRSTKTIKKKPQSNLLSEMIFSLRKTCPPSQSTAYNEKPGRFVERQLSRQSWVNSHRADNKIVVMKNFQLQVFF